MLAATLMLEKEKKKKKWDIEGNFTFCVCRSVMVKSDPQVCVFRPYVHCVVHSVFISLYRGSDVGGTFFIIFFIFLIFVFFVINGCSLVCSFVFSLILAEKVKF